MLKLRDYQQEAVDSIFDYFSKYEGNPILAEPTGVGKSLIIAGFLQRVFTQYANQRILILTHVKELIEQNFDKILRLWPTAPAGIYSAGLNRRDTNKPIIFAGIQSVTKKAVAFGHVDLIIIDECHLVSEKATTSYRTFIDELKRVNPNLKVIGLSATPYRLGLGKLTDGSIFTHICHDTTAMDAFNRYIDQGYLVPLIPKRTDFEIDTSLVPLSGGEFKIKELQRVADAGEATRLAISETVELGQERKSWLLFTTGIDHCNHVVDLLNEYDIKAAAIHSKLPTTVRDKILKDFELGLYTAVVNADVLTTGYDAPFVDMLVILRPTKSPGLWVQMLGRGTRPLFEAGFDLETQEGRLASIQSSRKHNCLVLDFAGNSRSLGPINDPRIPKKKGESKGLNEAPVKECKAELANGKTCSTWNHCSATHCIECGAEFPKTNKLFVSAAVEALIASSKPQVEIFKVDRVIYARHSKFDRPDSIKVTYHCGLKRFTEYLHFEHGGFSKTKAQNWWNERCDFEPPPTTNDALSYIQNVKTATHIRVWINKKYPEITSYDFTGTAFNTISGTAADSGSRFKSTRG